MAKSTTKTPGKAKTTTKTTRKSTAKAKTSSPKAKTSSPKAKTTVAKPAAAKQPAPLAAPEPIAAAPKIEPVVVNAEKPKVADASLRKENLLDEVAKRSGAKRKDVKPIVEAALAVLGEAVGDGVEINLKPLGKIKVARTKHVANGRVINLRLRQSAMIIKELSDTKDAAE